MKTKLFTSMIASIFLAVFLIGIVSGAEFHPSGLSGTAQQGQTVNLVFKIENTHTDDLTLISMTKSDLVSGSNIISSSNLNIQNLPSVINQSENSSEVTLQISVPSNQAIGTYTGELELFGNLTAINSRGELNVTLTVTQAPTPTIQHPEEIQEVINIGNLGGNLKIDISDISVIGFGDDDQYWYPMDEIELEIELENDGPEDIDNIEIGFGLWNVDEENWVIDDDRVEEVDIKDGDEEVVTITFQLDDPDELQGDNFILYVWAIGEDDEFDGNDTAEYDSLEIDIINDDDFVILDNIEFSPETGNCGDLVQITADVWNVGDNDQDDVSIVVASSDLGINERVVVGDINDFDSEPFTYTFEIPEDADEKRYIFTFEVYDEDNDIYETDEEEDEAKFTRTFDVAGGCRISGKAQLIISANLESGGKAGEQLVVRSTINNLENSRLIVSIEAEDYQNWADLISVSPSTAIIEAGDSEEVTFSFNVHKDVSGEQTFNIVVTPENAQSETQPVEVLIEESNFLSNLGENTIIYILAGLIVVVILLIVIVLIVRASRR